MELLSAFVLIYAGKLKIIHFIRLNKEKKMLD